jgi:molybdopterin synthase sulfur carrier subunit
MRVLYFAWLREKIGTGQETVTPPETVTTAAQLMDWLAGRSPAHAAALAERAAIRVAVDQRHARADESIAGAEEVAFFPPVTGGRAP